MNSSSGTKRNIIKFMLDLAAFIGFLVLLEPHLTGTAIHEWLAVAVTALVIIHLSLNWNWLVGITRRLFSKISWRSRICYILDWLLYISFVLIMLSGLMNSETLLPSLGIRLVRSPFWQQLHSLTTELIIFVLGAHVALHWDWIVKVVKRYVFHPRVSLRKSVGQKQESEA